MRNIKGKFIVLYGINNLGKTTQAKLLVEKIKENGLQAEHIKYPVYNLEPAGKLINDYLRNGNPQNFSPREFQLLHYIDRISFEPNLKEKLKQGINIVAEDYFGSALAWGVGAGVDKELLEYLYSFLYKEDLAFLFNGERFKNAIESGHKYENDDNLIKESRKLHIEFGKKYNWQEVNANLSIEEIHNVLWEKTKKIIDK